MTYLAENLSKQMVEKLSAVRLVAFDVDGVLTDGSLHYSAAGEDTKVFHVRDGVGLKLLVDAGIDVAVITAKDSKMVSTRMSEMGIRHYFPGSKDKAAVLETLANQLGLELEQTCFVGDDMVDLAAMQLSGFSICPADAYGFLASKADHHAPIAGGKGVARYVCDLILVSQNKYEIAYKQAMTPYFERKR